MYASPHARIASDSADCSNPEVVTCECIQEWIVNRLAECVGLDLQDIDLELHCTAYGVDSLTGISIVGDLELWLAGHGSTDIRLSPTLLWEMPSIHQLVQYLADAFRVASADDAKATHGNRPCTHGLSLTPDMARRLLTHLDHLSDQDVEAMLYQLAA